jgi:hypothetical protein
MASTKHIDVPDFDLLEGTVAPEILEATRIASKAMTKAKIRHALIGGLAVGAYGYVRATKDIDFIVGEEAFATRGPIVTFRAELPIEVNGIRVDTLWSDDVVEDEVDHPLVTRGVPIVTPEALVYLKLKAFRRRDQEDVTELLRLGIGEKQLRTFLTREAPDLLPRFDTLVERSEEEE